MALHARERRESFTQVPNESIIWDTGLHIVQRTILIYLWSCRRPCCPAISVIARHVGCGVRTATKHLHLLEAMGRLKIIRRGRNTNEYVVRHTDW